MPGRPRLKLFLQLRRAPPTPTRPIETYLKPPDYPVITVQYRHGDLKRKEGTATMIPVIDPVSTIKHKPEIVVARDHVIICGQVVMRPAHFSPSQWMHFWERVQ